MEQPLACAPLPQPSLRKLPPSGLCRTYRSLGQARMPPGGHMMLSVTRTWVLRLSLGRCPCPWPAISPCAHPHPLALAQAATRSAARAEEPSIQRGRATHKHTAPCTEHSPTHTWRGGQCYQVRSWLCTWAGPCPRVLPSLPTLLPHVATHLCLCFSPTSHPTMASCPPCTEGPHFSLLQPHHP